MRKDLVTLGMAESARQMAIAKGVPGTVFQEAQKDGRYSAYLDELKNPYLRKISEGTLGVTDGTEELKNDGNPFIYVDPDFKNWGVTGSTLATKPCKWKGSELVKDATFLQFLGENPNCWEGMAQVTKFVREHKDKLIHNGAANLFPLKGGFVANVNRNSDGWNVNVNRLSNDNVWNAENRHRVFVPKLIFSLALLREFLFFNQAFSPTAKLSADFFQFF